MSQNSVRFKCESYVAGYAFALADPLTFHVEFKSDSEGNSISGQPDSGMPPPLNL